MENNSVLDDRKDFILLKQEGCGGNGLRCDSDSVSGAVSQRACVYCGARVVLNPITDAFHIVHGPIGCASYTWDIRGSLSSGSDLYRNSFSTDLQEKDVIFGGEKKLTAAIEEVIENYHPKLIFIYATCIVGVIGDDVEAVCKAMSSKYNTRVIPVKSPGFAGNKNHFLSQYRTNLEGKKAAIYVGGGFKAISLIRQFRSLGIETIVVGTQTGKKEDYEIIESLVGENTVILDDANPAELEKFIKEKGADILVGGVKERPLAYKLGVAFCDHNHERKHPLCGFDGVVNFTMEINQSINHPVWKYIKKEAVI